MDRLAARGFAFALSLIGIILLSIARGSRGKQCTNGGLQSHTLRALSIAPYQLEIATAAPDPVQYSPRRLQDVTLQQTHKFKGSENRMAAFLQPVSLHNVSLASDSPQGIAQLTNLRYLLMLDLDSLVWNFRKTAGLKTLGSAYGGWESPNSELRGHFVGHYLSATALMWASTHEDALVDKMNPLVEALAECQNNIGTGYLSGFPSELFDRFEALQSVWAPYYTIHKILAGLLDQYTYVGNQKAFEMVLWMAKYFFNRVQLVIEKYTIERHWQSLNEETGGMNDVLYRLYSITGDSQHLTLAHLFDKPCFLGMLAVEADSLSGFHTNTHIPVVVGAQMRYEVIGDEQYKDISEFFLETVNSSHRFVTGGTSSGEFWTDPNRLGDTLHTEDEESCTTYNMLKVARNLFRWTKRIIYADYYERALLNGVLSIQRGQEPGVMIYMLPLGPGDSKARSYHGWGTPFDSFWCCYGTGIESFSKLGDSVYFQEESDIPNLYVIQFVSSTLFWENAELFVNQSVASPTWNNPELQVTFHFFISDQHVSEDVNAIFNVRVPSWTTSEGCQALLNGERINVPTSGSFLTIQRKWADKDELSLLFPMILATEKVQDDRLEFSSLHAILFGPYVLAGLTDGERSFGSTMNLSSLPEWIIPVDPSISSQLYTFSQDVLASHEGLLNKNNFIANETLIRLDKSPFVLSHHSGSIVMDRLPSKGTDAALSSTFHVVSPVANILLDYRSLAEGLSSFHQSSSLLFEAVSLELFDRPGSYLAHQGKDGSNITILFISPKPEGIPNDDLLKAVFNILPSLSGEEHKISFQAAGLPGCYIYAPIDAAKQEGVELRCSGSKDDTTFNHATSFSVQGGLSSYHPMSFIAYGPARNYLLYPLSAFMDESYTVYFDMA
ncbi:hypothetical protein O6H91_20G037800 [Diphasiastrum complanatum]|uniref:Uncharacterized protein n=1 Tax=Diphasiastrum complanatum TaxID=34168 RepID=A0ACC2AR18_DIPCM|nr:hypothetical protein O6H91_20G037800 [Diphasiastrum complanatum]